MSQGHSAGVLRLQVIASVAAIVAAGAMAALALGRQAVARVDADAAARETRLVSAAIAQRVADLPIEQHSATIWDEAVLQVRAGDGKWMEGNLGVWMQDYFGHDRNYVLAPDLVPIHAAEAGETVPADAYAAVAGAVDALVRTVRAEVDRNRTAPEEIGAADYLMLETQPALVSVVPIVPDTDEVRQAPAETALHVAVDYLDDAYASGIANGLELASGRITPPGMLRPGELSVPLRDSAGAEIAAIAWTPAMPGRQLVQGLLPAILVTLAVGTGLVMLLLRRLIRTSLRLDRSEARARHLAYHDPLTGLPNRILFEDRLGRAMRAAVRGGPDVTLLMIDLDRFKQVNDTLGHPAGDALISQVGARIEALVRRGDTAARLGGDEFGVILRGRLSSGDLAAFCERLTDEVSRPYDLRGQAAHVAASIGAVSASSGVRDANEMVRRADIALYLSKRQGRDRYSVFSEEMEAEMRREDAIERDLRHALEADPGQIVLEFEPIFDREGRIAGAEAFPRWTHPEHGGLAPEIVRRVAEKRGLTRALESHILAQACRQAVASGLPRVAVGITALQLCDGGFAALVLGILDEAGMAPGQLELELSEEGVLQESEVVDRQIAVLRRAGVGITLSQFATGRFVMQRVRDLDVRSLKIGSTLVRELGQTPTGDATLRALMDFLHVLGMQVIASGVETPAQRLALAGMGCARFQTHPRRAMTPEEVAALRPGRIA